MCPSLSAFRPGRMAIRRLSGNQKRKVPFSVPINGNRTLRPKTRNVFHFIQAAYPGCLYLRSRIPLNLKLLRKGCKRRINCMYSNSIDIVLFWLRQG